MTFKETLIKHSIKSLILSALIFGQIFAPNLLQTNGLKAQEADEETILVTHGQQTFVVANRADAEKFKEIVRKAFAKFISENGYNAADHSNLGIHEQENWDGSVNLTLDLEGFGTQGELIVAGFWAALGPLIWMVVGATIALIYMHVKVSQARAEEHQRIRNMEDCDAQEKAVRDSLKRFIKNCAGGNGSLRDCVRADYCALINYLTLTDVEPDAHGNPTEHNRCEDRYINNGPLAPGQQINIEGRNFTVPGCEDV